MSKRGGSSGYTKVMSKEEDPVPLSESLGPVKEETPKESLDIEERFETERQNTKVKHWKENPHCAGLVEVTWEDERVHGSCVSASNFDDEPCCGNHCSAMLCSKLGAGRIGNMVVLRQSQEWVEEVTEDEETGQETTRRFTRPRYDCVVGPFWPMMLCVTYPLILGISGWTLVSAIPTAHYMIAAAWAICTIGLIVSLAFTACRDPGILPKYESPPPQEEGSWRWNDQAQSYRPKGAIYDSDCAVVVEDFDHTCPWTGTAIGKKNMTPFGFFVALVFVCLVFDILLLTGALAL